MWSPERRGVVEPVILIARLAVVGRYTKTCTGALKYLNRLREILWAFSRPWYKKSVNPTEKYLPPLFIKISNINIEIFIRKGLKIFTIRK